MNTVRYSFVTIAHFLIISAVMPFTSFYLVSQGCSNFASGSVLAIGGIVAIFLLPFAGSFSDRTTKVSLPAMIGILTAFIIVCAIPLLLNIINKVFFIGLLLTFIIVAIYLTMPLVNSLCIYYENRGVKINFGVARGMGSLSYTVGLVVIGYFCDESRLGPRFVPIAIIGSSIFLIVAAIVFHLHVRSVDSAPVTTEGAPKKGGSVGAFFRKYPRFLCLLAGLACLFTAHNTINNFCYQFCVQLGRGTYESGIAGGIAAFAELPTMFLFALMMKKIKPAVMIRISAVFFCLKTVMVAFALTTGSLTLFYCAMPFQMFGYALFTPASVYYTNMVIAEEDLVTGQSVMSTTNALGGVIASLLGGFLLDRIAPVGTIWVMFAVCVAGALISFVFVRPKKRPVTETGRG